MTLDDWLDEREKVRSRERQLTQKIKAERLRLTRIKHQVAKEEAASGAESDSYKALVVEYGRLRRLCAALLKDEGITYKALGEKLGCSGSRAREIVERAYRELRKYS